MKLVVVFFLTKTMLTIVLIAYERYTLNYVNIIVSQMKNSINKVVVNYAIIRHRDIGCFINSVHSYFNISIIYAKKHVFISPTLGGN